METLQTIFNRKSIRKYLSKTISKEDLDIILAAGQAGPSAVNARPWQFLVINDKQVLKSYIEVCGHAMKFAENADVLIIIMGYLDRAYQRGKDYWIVDASIAAQNMILAATDLGIGTCWLGQWPQQDKINITKEFFHLPEGIIPHSVISFGYSDEDPKNKKTFESELVHYNQY